MAEAVVAVSAGYFGSALTPVEAKAADEAVASLLARVADGEDVEAAAQVIGLLVQACDATARLVEHARRAAPDGLPARNAVAVLGEVLRHDPPVPALRRRAVADVRAGDLELRAGEAVLIDVT
ncbi:isocitrate lyase/phosphoenolpyruvate mutase family protein, partial [Kitasatospora sp. NPDC093558]